MQPRPSLTLDVWKLLKKNGPMTVDQIAARMGLHRSALSAVLRESRRRSGTHRFRITESSPRGVFFGCGPGPDAAPHDPDERFVARRPCPASELRRVVPADPFAAMVQELCA